MKLLLVDDSGTMRAIQKRCLLRLGVTEEEIIEAGDGKAALDVFANGDFDLVLTDWNMPNMDGLSLLKNIRQQNTEIQVIMVTTEAEKSRVLEAVQAGASDYLVKPFTPDALAEKLRKWLPALKA